VIYVDDKLPTHPKIFRAGARLGTNGPAQAIAVFLAGLAYAREHLTDGFLPDRFVAACALVERPETVARVLADRRIKLWHRTRGGYQIHDYHDWNKKASEIKEKRERERIEKRGKRSGAKAVEKLLKSCASPICPPGTNLGPHALARPRTTYHDPRTTYPVPSNPEVEVGREGRSGTQSRSVAAPPRALSNQSALPPPSATQPARDGNLAVMVKLAHEAFDELHESEPTAEVVARVKELCAQRSIDYGRHPDVSPDVVRKAVESAAAQRTLVPVHPGRGGGPTGLSALADDFRLRLDAMRARKHA
jgi:hypothetical protein